MGTRLWSVLHARSASASPMNLKCTCQLSLPEARAPHHSAPVSETRVLESRAALRTSAVVLGKAGTVTTSPWDTASKCRVGAGPQPRPRPRPRCSPPSRRPRRHRRPRPRCRPRPPLPLLPLLLRPTPQRRPSPRRCRCPGRRRPGRRCRRCRRCPRARAPGTRPAAARARRRAARLHAPQQLSLKHSPSRSNAHQTPPPWQLFPWLSRSEPTPPWLPKKCGMEFRDLLKGFAPLCS